MRWIEDHSRQVNEAAHLAAAASELLAHRVSALGTGPLTEDAVATTLRPLFSLTLASPHIYLASHSLGRPLDRVEDDLREGVSLWQDALTGAWSPWLEEEGRYRGGLATLLNAPRPDCVVPRVSAGHALRSVLNMLPSRARVLSTEGEFDSVAMLLQQYAAVGRIELELLPPNASGHYDSAALITEIERRATVGRAPALFVVSEVFYATGQLLMGLDALANTCHKAGTELLVDSYHSLGVVPIDVAAMGCDYLIGGCYKYLRGGPGAAFLYISPDALAGGRRPVDTGWFALEPGALLAPLHGGPVLRPGGDAHLEGTPPVLTYYQARSGLAFTSAVGVDRLRAYSLQQLRTLKALLAEHGIRSIGGDADHGAFLTIASHASEALVEALAEKGIIANARRERLRLCPDCLTTTAELEATVKTLAGCRGWLAD